MDPSPAQHRRRAETGAAKTGTAPHHALPPARVREVPLGRTALWWCLGLGLGMIAGELSHLVTRGAIDLPDPAAADPVLSVVLAVWPWGLAGAAGALLLAGLAQARVAVDRRESAHLRRAGRPALAQVRRAAAGPGPRARVDVVLLVPATTGRLYTTALRWELDPIDAGRVQVGAVLPVRVDPADPRRAVLDTEADSREEASAADLPRAHPLNGVVARMVWWSRAALLAGLAVGAFIVLA